MNTNKFLTVYAVFDETTQAKLSCWQNKILQSGLIGSQSMDIPFHISLGSFPVDQKEELLKQIICVGRTYSSFSLQLQAVKTFGNKVLYLEPDESNDIAQLHTLFDGNYADGLPFVPHTTLFIGADDRTLHAKEILLSCFEPISVQITELHLSEFFPTKFIGKQKLKNN